MKSQLYKTQLKTGVLKYRQIVLTFWLWYMHVYVLVGERIEHNLI